MPGLHPQPSPASTSTSPLAFISSLPLPHLPPFVHHEHDCNRYQADPLPIKVFPSLFCRAGWHLMYSVQRTWNNSNGCSYKQCCLRRYFFCNHNLPTISFVFISSCLMFFLSLHSLITTSACSPIHLPFTPPNSLLIFIPQLYLSSDFSFLTSFSTPVSYFLSGCPKNTSGGSCVLPLLPVSFVAKLGVLWLESWEKGEGGLWFRISFNHHIMYYSFEKNHNKWIIDYIPSLWHSVLVEFPTLQRVTVLID